MTGRDEGELSLVDLDFVAGPLEFGRLSPEEFEHLVFHLLDEMGYQELVWRKGGPGNSANDGGRDLEGSLGTGDLLPGRRRGWWFEVKLRGKRLETASVQSTLHNANAERDLASLAIITNATVSNDCLDWARKFGEQHRLEVTICQGHDLERLLRANPRTMLRFFRDALSFTGQCKAVAARLVHQFLLPGTEELHLLYLGRSEISDPRVVSAACMAESAHGDPASRRWGVVLSDTQLSHALAWVLRNLDELASVANLREHSHQPLASGIAYLLASLMSRGLVESAKDILRNPEGSLDGGPNPPTASWRQYRTRFAVRCLLNEIVAPCSIMCPKLSTGSDDPEANGHFFRFCPEEIQGVSDKAHPPFPQACVQHRRGGQ
ncbi:MAG: restriction endonuclease [Planctomycetota bacterium]